MTRKDFELIAEAIQKSRKFATKEEQSIVDSIVDILAVFIKAEHPRFDEYRFRLASGNIQEEVIDGVKHIRLGKNRIFA